MSIGEGYKRNNKEKGNWYCDHNMAGNDNTGLYCYLDMGNNTVMYYKCSHVPNLRSRMCYALDHAMLFSCSK